LGFKDLELYGSYVRSTGEKNRFQTFFSENIANNPVDFYDITAIKPVKKGDYIRFGYMISNDEFVFLFNLNTFNATDHTNYKKFDITTLYTYLGTIVSQTKEYFVFVNYDFQSYGIWDKSNLIFSLSDEKFSLTNLQVKNSVVSSITQNNK
jgi:hypothetical protein